MKVKRLKHARRLLSFYKRHFNVHEPYQILVDGTFSQVALQSKIYIKEQLPKYLDGHIQLMTTACVLAEARSLGPELLGAVLILKRFQQRRCSHGHQPVLAADCIRSLVGTDNSQHYLVATQDAELKKTLREIPGVPLIHICHNAITLENASRVSKRRADELSRTDPHLSSHEHETLEKLKLTLPQQEQRPRRKRHCPQGPNPLSIKRKKMMKKTDKQRKTRRKPKRLAPGRQFTNTEESV